ncbi:hypothetical protein RRG08_043312 [Elysia crispata]|uniref:Uncharacterized protein n=1 Tax=Elysia crispata TaxID=231223 RepID=A0AAE0XYN0_9GAST|nr:hypothetical protein RRG08_043312 [Elysia crispata]
MQISVTWSAHTWLRQLFDVGMQHTWCLPQEILADLKNCISNCSSLPQEIPTDLKIKLIESATRDPKRSQKLKIDFLDFATRDPNRSQDKIDRVYHKTSQQISTSNCSSLSQEISTDLKIELIKSATRDPKISRSNCSSLPQEIPTNLKIESPESVTKDPSRSQELKIDFLESATRDANRSQDQIPRVCQKRSQQI